MRGLLIQWDAPLRLGTEGVEDTYQEEGGVAGESSRGRPVEGACDHSAVGDHGEYVKQFLSPISCQLVIIQGA